MGVGPAAANRTVKQPAHMLTPADHTPALPACLLICVMTWSVVARTSQWNCRFSALVELLEQHYAAVPATRGGQRVLPIYCEWEQLGMLGGAVLLGYGMGAA